MQQRVRAVCALVKFQAGPEKEKEAKRGIYYTTVQEGQRKR